MRTVDARGFSCPQPVIMTKKAMKEDGDLDVFVDNRVALENVTRFAESSGATVKRETIEGGWKLGIRRS